MVIYGTALLAACVLCGLLLGDALGWLIGVKANVGGVGFAMLLLIASSEWLRGRGALTAPTQQGIAFWSAIYIPVVVAMAALQNVAAALRGGLAAVLAGGLAVLACGVLIPLLDRRGRSGEPAAEP
ncbi:MULTISPECIES: malonate transporter subunit MadL [unclassified Chromobacterium]|uniref:malonate transporter subunit MadL n=1 Tax=unclassified Chromobacterium TaxID=2641838 RepID=UPI001F39F379|nr:MULTISPECIES: malonate transporter subunit MadL [unclassified Chromobacterium]MCP1291923.1 malonate transporter subunit MadL [Chromobacterium sp. S0633]UJB32169.1 malonate transporter subunit MadL [Chromobacterium sp. Beijing]